MDIVGNLQMIGLSYPTILEYLLGLNENQNFHHKFISKRTLHFNPALAILAKTLEYAHRIKFTE